MQTILLWGVGKLIVIVFELFMPYVIIGLAPGFAGGDSARFTNAIFMARLTMPYLR